METLQTQPFRRRELAGGAQLTDSGWSFTIELEEPVQTRRCADCRFACLVFAVERRILKERARPPVPLCPLCIERRERRTSRDRE